MHWARALDTTLFHWINPAWSNSLLDTLMPFVSGNRFFAPAFILALIVTFWKGGVRGRLCVFMLIMAVALGDSFICNTLKHAIQRPRPFLTLTDVHMPAGIGRTDSGSMPSSHAANWFAATIVLFVYYCRSIWLMLPMAMLVGFSRVYNGVHYPGDVLVGAILGAGYAATGIWTLNALWQWAGRRWFPIWHERLPSLLDPVARPPAANPDTHLLDLQWMRLGYVLIVLQLIVNLLYLASGMTDLTGDEAYQWTWSKHLALSYYSKPPFIAYFQFLGTHLWGDTVFGVRFFSPVIAAIISVCLLRFMARVVSVRAAFWLSIAVPLVPLFAVGSILMTIDPPSVLFWTLAMIAGWKAIQEKSAASDWAWVGLWMGLGFLSKYHELFQLASWALVFAFLPSARIQLRRQGPWLALAVNILCATPVIIWNWQHNWITLRSLSESGHFDKHWVFTPANIWYGLINYTSDFLGLQVALENPFFFLPTVWAGFAFWRRKPRQPLLLYFFCMGVPVFLYYFLQSIHSRVLPNWVVQSIIPFFCLSAAYWDDRWRSGFHAIRYWLYAGLIVGFFAVIVMHDTRLIGRATGWNLPTKWDPTRRGRGWTETADAVEAIRQKLLAEGKPVFIVGSHYEITGELSFHLPEARAGLPDHPVVYYQSSKHPDNQFYFWPGYKDRKGENAIYMQELDFAKPEVTPPHPPVTEEFTSVTDLGMFTISNNGQPVRYIQIYECRNLR